MKAQRHVSCFGFDFFPEDASGQDLGHGAVAAASDVCSAWSQRQLQHAGQDVCDAHTLQAQGARDFFLLLLKHSVLNGFKDI